MKEKDIIDLLPYSKPFLFVDTLTSINENEVVGTYTFQKDDYFYQGHFKNNPVTPGVILTECMAQIGLVCLGIYLLKDELDLNHPPQIAFTSSLVDFFVPVYPGETVEVVSKKQVFRFGKLKCTVQMFNERKELVCRGQLSGMFKTKNQ